MIIGITGGTGCGKTTALNAIRELGGTVIDCDAVYHQLLLSDSSLLQALQARFPGTVQDGILDRKALGARVFSDPGALEALNAITNPVIVRHTRQLLRQASGLAAIDAIRLFESGLATLCCFTVGITAPLEARIQRLMSRDSISADYALKRIQAQPSEDFFRTHCDYILENTGSAEEFHTKCLAFFRNADIIKEELQ